MAAVKCYVRKARFFPLVLNRRGEARALCGFQHHKGGNRFCLSFSDPITVGLRITRHRMGSRCRLVNRL